MSSTPRQPDGVNVIGQAGPIDGVRVIPLRRIPDERGTIHHMLKRSDPHFTEFGEIYFSTAYPEVVKGWHLHENATLHYACIFGRVKLVLFDERSSSPTTGGLMEIFLGVDNYSLIIIPPGVWNGFKGMSEPYAIVANCCSQPHDEMRSRRLDPFSGHVPYNWAVKHE
ncbi:MAG: dTDP-4-dehydrorhamnose 3,5-epimerase family protein [Chloroflexi bacterium]|nr:dTDP-4-dehydrorhamnose 3,5-epimerase family protein [Chloroflexota bacterium]